MGDWSHPLIKNNNTADSKTKQYIRFLIMISLAKSLFVIIRKYHTVAPNLVYPALSEVGVQVLVSVKIFKIHFAKL